MYLQFYGLNEAPFAITPDPAFVYLSPEHRDALAHLLYGVGQGGAGGFVQLTGEVGTGKTTMCRCLLEQLPDNTQVALVLNPLLTPGELLATICEELGISTEGIVDSNKALVDALNAHLLRQHGRGCRVVVMIDEAQNLSPEALEQVRLLTNLETPKEKLLQMVLLGQPELRQLLQRSDLRQLAQRITARYHLKPLNQEETRAYVRHRMMVAGAQRSPFTRSALRALYQRSGGVPRLINIIADRALAGAYARETSRVNAGLIQAAANEVQPSEKNVRSSPWPGILATASALLLVVVSFVIWAPAWLENRQPSSMAKSPSAAADSLPAANVPSETELPAQADPPAVGTVAVQDRLEPEEEEIAEVIPVDQLDGAWLDKQHLGAWRSLAGLWQQTDAAPAIQAACDGMAGTGFACLSEAGSWSRIRHLGLPVLLVLNDSGRRLLVLNGFKGELAAVGAAEDARMIPRNEIENSWLGEFLVAWPQAPDWPPDIRRGQAGPAVDIVMQMAAFAEPAWQGGGAFDATFEAWLVEFQRRNGLQADGIVGPKTLIYLMAPTIVEPRLMLETEKEL